MAAAVEAMGKKVLAGAIGEDGMMLWTGLEGALARFHGPVATQDLRRDVRTPSTVATTHTAGQPCTPPLLATAVQADCEGQSDLQQGHAGE